MSAAPAAVRLARVIVQRNDSRQRLSYIVAAPVNTDADAIAAALDTGDRVVAVDWLDTVDTVANSDVAVIAVTNERGTTLLV